MPSYTFYTNYGNRTVKAKDATDARSIVRGMLEVEAYTEDKEAPVAWDIYLIESKPKNTEVRARVNPEIVSEVNKVLEGTGRTKSDIIRSLLEQIASEKKLPDYLYIPNTKTIDAMKESRALLKKKALRNYSLKENKKD